MTMESAADIFAAIMLPWLCGYAIIRLLLGERLPFSLYAGHGYLVGLYLVILLLQLWNAAGWPLRFWPLATVLAVITIPALWKLHRRDSLVPLAPKSPLRTPGWKYVITTLLVALIFMHLLVVLQEVWLRPIFPWDAWRGWAPKAIQFFDNRALSFEMGTIANYGIISPQIHLWAMLASGTTLEPMLYLPWYFALVALAMAVYGHLRLHCSTLPSLLGAYLVASLPYLNIHTSLAGYADLWLTLAFTLGLMTITLYQHQKRAAIVVLAVLYAVISVQAKRAGLGLGLIVLLCFAMANSRWSKVWGTVLMVSTVIIAGLIYATLNDIVSVRIDIPSIGTLILDSDQIRVPMVGGYDMDYLLNVTPFTEALLLFTNWHLATYLCLAMIVYSILSFKWKNISNPILTAVVLGFVYIFVYFTLVSPQAAADHTGLSRSLLYTMPAIIWWTITTVMRSYSVENLYDLPALTEAQASPSVPATPFQNQEKLPPKR